MIAMSEFPDTPPPEDTDAQERPDYDPRHDSEALLLSAMLWAGQRGDLEPVRSAIEVVTAGDFYRPHYAKLFSLIAQRCNNGKPTDSATAVARLSALGTRDGMPARDAYDLMATLLNLQAQDLLAREYAEQVLSMSYRRQFQRMVADLSQIAAEAPEDALFEHLVVIGKQQRTAWQRFNERRARRERSA